MELFSNLPDEIQGLALSYNSKLCNATEKQLWLFKRMEPWLQAIVFTGNYRREVVQSSWRKRCSFLGFTFPLRISLYSYFNHPGALEERPHCREHGMCSKCKKEEARQAAMRQERLDGLARFQQAWRDDDEEGILYNHHWCGVDSLYDACEDWNEYHRLRYPWEYEAY